MLCLVVAAGSLVVGVSSVAGATSKARTRAAAIRGACTLQGAANISPGLTTKAQPISFGFTGKLGSCQGLTGVKSGTVTASGSGTGSCSGNSTAGTATISWNNGQSSTLAFTTKGTGVVVQVAGKITSGLFVGLPVKAELLFYTLSPQKCATVGLTSASFAGPATVGV
jgi:hypothetical protein